MDRMRSERPGGEPGQMPLPKDVVISILSSQTSGDGEKESTELITEGVYAYGKDDTRLSYLESELTGLDGTRTIFQVRPGEVILSRRGAVHSEMKFRQGECIYCMYQTEYGVLQMGLDTRRLHYDLNEHGGSLEVVFDLDIQRNFISRNTFRVNVREQKKDKGLKA